MITKEFQRLFVTVIMMRITFPLLMHQKKKLIAAAPRKNNIVGDKGSGARHKLNKQKIKELEERNVQMHVLKKLRKNEKKNTSKITKDRARAI